MKPALIIVSILAAVAIFFAIWYGVKNKKAVAANRVLDPNGVVTPSVVAAVSAASPTVQNIASTSLAANADALARAVKA